MQQKKTLATEADVALLVEAFYTKAKPDPVIGHFFTEVKQIDWAHHIPVIVSFWDSMLFGSRSYRGNPMEKHMALDTLSRIEPAHFARWLSLWKETVDEYFEGDKAEESKRRAEGIAGLMQVKVQAQRGSV
ncbi:MAG: group III truncated hemoglobin [Bacteroidia bacterium]|nr:group III truncated hemoglobin [Bacteroidia bacterium]